MFNLIISIIAIALVVVLAGASLYYGGSAFNEGSSDAKAATLINQAQQIQASATLYSATEGGAPVDIDSLLLEGQYMAAEPVVPVGTPAEDGTPYAEWDLHSSTGGTAADMVAVEMGVGTKSDEGITVEICETINEDGAGVVHCHGDVLTNVSLDSTFEATVDPQATVATVYMAL